MIKTVLILDVFDRMDFWKEINVDLAYNLLDFASGRNTSNSTSSDTLAQDIDILTMAIDLFDIILSKGFTKLCFIANGVPASMIALKLASLLRGRDDIELCKLCLVGGSSSPPSRGLLIQSLYHVKDPKDFLGLYLSPSCLSKSPTFSKIYIDSEIRNCKLDHLADAIQEFVMPPEELLLLTSIPLLLLHGEKDISVDFSFSFAIHDRWPGSEIHVLPNTGHWLHVENPVEFFNLIQEWMKST